MNKVRNARARYTTHGDYCKIEDVEALGNRPSIGSSVSFVIAPARAYRAPQQRSGLVRQGYLFASWPSTRKEATVQQSPATAAAIGTS